MTINGKFINLNEDADAEKKIKTIIESFHLDNIPTMDTAISWFVRSPFFKKAMSYDDVSRNIKILFIVIARVAEDRLGIDGMNLPAYAKVLYELYFWRDCSREALLEIISLLLETELLRLDFDGTFYLHDICNLGRAFTATTADIEITKEDGNLGSLKDFINISLAIYKEVGGEYHEPETIARMESLIKSL